MFLAGTEEMQSDIISLL